MAIVELTIISGALYVWEKLFDTPSKDEKPSKPSLSPSVSPSVSHDESRDDASDEAATDASVDTSVVASVSNAMTKVAGALRILKEETLPLLLGDARQQQVDELASDEDREQRALAEARVNRNIRIAAGSLGLAVIGALAYPPLGLAGMIGSLYASRYIHEQTYAQLKRGQFTVDSLVTITMVGSLVGGYYVISGIAVLIFQMSRKLLVRITDDSRKKLVDVFREQPRSAWLVTDGVELQVPLHRLQVGDSIAVHAGEVIPVDGVITEGVASVDQHILTGEARPIDKGVEDEVFAATVVLSGRIVMRVDKAGDDTTVAQIGQILNQTVEFKSTIQLRAQTLADQTVLPTLACAGLAFPLQGGYASLGVVNAHFKHQMSLAAPIGILNILDIASRHGILIKDGRTLDLLEQVDTIVFDKTGTLTDEQPSVGQIHASSAISDSAVAGAESGYSASDILMFAAAAEYRQSHPIARAITERAKREGIELPDIQDAEYRVGYGLTVAIDGKVVHVGSRRFMTLSDLGVPLDIRAFEQSCLDMGHTVVMVAVDGAVIGAIELVPTARPEAARVIQALKQRANIEHTYIISGDHEAPTRRLADELGIDRYYAETLPESKAELIEGLRDEGRFICYVGDGINDSIALKASHVSVSLRGASSVATDTAQVILMDEGLTQLPFLFELAEELDSNSRTTFGIITSLAAFGVGGAVLVGMGLGATIALNLAGVSLGTLNSMRPLIKYRMNELASPGDGISFSPTAQPSSSEQAADPRADEAEVIAFPGLATSGDTAT